MDAAGIGLDDLIGDTIQQFQQGGEPETVKVVDDGYEMTWGTPPVGKNLIEGSHYGDGGCVGGLGSGETIAAATMGRDFAGECLVCRQCSGDLGRSANR